MITVRFEYGFWDILPYLLPYEHWTSLFSAMYLILYSSFFSFRFISLLAHHEPRRFWLFGCIHVTLFCVFFSISRVLLMNTIGDDAEDSFIRCTVTTLLHTTFGYIIVWLLLLMLMMISSFFFFFLITYVGILAVYQTFSFVSFSFSIA